MKISIFRCQKEDKYCRILNETAQDKELSFKARGILLYLLSKPDDWKPWVKDIVNQGNGSEKSFAISAGLKELRNLGYAELQKCYRKGKVHCWRLFISDFRKFKTVGKIKVVKLERGQSLVGDLDVADHYHTNTDKKQTKDGGGKESLRSSKDPSTNGIFESNGGVSPFIKLACTKLENFIRSSRKINGRRINQTYWHSQMRLLLQDIEGDKGRLKQILKAFIETPHNERTPQVECAQSFRDKFLRIESWINKYAPPPPKEEYEVIIESRRTVE